MYCNQCGNKVNKEDNYCIYCGNKIQKAKTIISNNKKIINESREQSNVAKIKNEEKEYQKPSIEILKKQDYIFDKNYIKETQQKLEEFFKENKIEGKITKYYNSPNFITYAFSLKSGTKIESITKRIKDLEAKLDSPKIKLEIAINNTNNLGIIVKKQTQNAICLRNVLEADKNKNDFMSIPFGIDYLNKKYYYDISKLKNIIIKGSTGSGKSILINDIIVSILMKATPEEVKLVLIDQKKIELGIYNGIPHLLTPVVTDPIKASITLKTVVVEMERRYDLFEKTKVKNIVDYNKLIEEKNKKLSLIDKLQKMPYIIVIIDEISDLITVSRTEIENSIMHLTQMAFTTGIHLIISTSLLGKTIGLIEASFLTKIELNNRKNDLLLSLDGDMIIKNDYEHINDKIQSPFISEEEINKVIDNIILKK